MTEDGDLAKRETRWNLNSLAVGALIGGWAFAALISFVLGDLAEMRFLDLPIGAYLAGQGALVAIVVVGIRIAAPAAADD